jgi:L-lactate dehydrogenase complex protein LldG
LSRRGRIERLPWPLAAWSSTRDLAEPPKETFRDWWCRERGEAVGGSAPERVPASRTRRSPRPKHPGAPAASGRDAILARIREAIRDAPSLPEAERSYRRRSERSPGEIASLFAERVSEYRADAVHARAGVVGEVVAERCRRRGVERLAVPEGLPEAWRPQGPELIPGHGLGPSELDAVGGVLSGCAVAIAETGTIVLDGGVAQGPRALTLVPDYHLCVVGAEQIVELVPEAVERLGPAVRRGRPLTFVSGPSATSDIELDRVEGVHGPRMLDVVIVS